MGICPNTPKSHIPIRLLGTWPKASGRLISIRDLFASGAPILKRSRARRGESAASPVVFTGPQSDAGIVFGIDGRMKKIAQPLRVEGSLSF